MRQEVGWTLDIGEPDGTAIISGIPLVTGINLLAQYQHLIVGSLFVLSDVEIMGRSRLCRSRRIVPPVF